MKTFRSVLAFAAGCLTAGLVAWLVTDVRAQEPGGRVIHVCVSNDRVLHLTAPLTGCPAGESSLQLKPANDATPQPDSKDSPLDKARMDALERRIKQLEDSAAGGTLANRVVAPFEVVDRAGKRIFLVRADSPQVAVYNPDGKPVARIGAGDAGGYFAGASSTQEIEAAIGASGARANVIVRENGITRIDAGKDDTAENYRLKIFGSTGTLLAGIGQTTTNTGMAVVSDASGDVKARLLATTQHKGKLSIHNGDKEIAVLTEGANAGGLLEVYSSGGQTMVAAGVAAEGYGIVRAGPEAFKPGYGVLGLPGSYLTGKP